MSRLGRPKKGRTRRVPITIHAPTDTLDLIDDYLEEHAEEIGRAYSRSDFYNEAARALLRARGVDPEEPEDGERTENVPKKL